MGSIERHALALAILSLAGCDKKDEVAAEPPATPSASAPEPSEPPPGGCKASGVKPAELGTTTGFVYGFAGDATHVYYTSWDIYGNRGDFGSVRKDGGGRRALASLSLEPRGLAVDDGQVFYTAGIRLMKFPKGADEPSVLADKFSSQEITLDGKFVYGVPGDYGPYDRLVRLPKNGGVTWELDVAERPEVKQGPNGYNGIAVDGDGIYVADSGGDRVLKFPLERGKPKTLAARQPRPLHLATDGAHVYFTLSKAGNLMKVPKSGGQATKLLAGLVDEARLAADDAAVFTTLAGESDDAPARLVKLTLPDGKASPIAVVPKGQSVEAITLDQTCVYWAQRDSGTKQAVVYTLAR
jgi:hypothetical protein